MGVDFYFLDGFGIDVHLKHVITALCEGDRHIGIEFSQTENGELFWGFP